MSSFSWYGHRQFVYLVSISTEGFDYDKTVEYIPHNYIETRKYTEFYSTEPIFDYLKIDELKNQNLENLHFLIENHKNLADIGSKVPVWKVLTLYTSFPDNGMDFGIVDDETTKKILSVAKFFGIEYLTTFRHGKIKYNVFEALNGDESFAYYFELSRYAQSKNDKYWQIRFLSYALHYAMDLFQPYHIKIGEPLEVMQIIWNKEMINYLTNCHELYDSYLYFLLTESKHASQVRELVLNSKPLFVSGEPLQVAREIVIYSYVNFDEIHRTIKSTFGTDLTGNLKNFPPNFFVSFENSGKLEELYAKSLPIIEMMSKVLKGIIILNLK